MVILLNIDSPTRFATFWSFAVSVFSKLYNAISSPGVCANVAPSSVATMVLSVFIVIEYALRVVQSIVYSFSIRLLSIITDTNSLFVFIVISTLGAIIPFI